jgi:hypothetical protein
MEENNSENKKPNFWQRLKLWQKIVLGIIVLGIISGILGINNSDKPKYNSTVRLVTAGHFQAYPDIPIGEAFANFFANTKWESFVSDDGRHIVEFDGVASLGGEPVTVEIQFEIDKGRKSFEVVWLGVDGETQPNYEIHDWIDTVYEKYYKDNE